MEPIWTLIEKLDHEQGKEGSHLVHSPLCRRCQIEVGMRELMRVLDLRLVSKAIELIGNPAMQPPEAEETSDLAGL